MQLLVVYVLEILDGYSEEEYKRQFLILGNIWEWKRSSVDIFKEKNNPPKSIKAIFIVF